MRIELDRQVTLRPYQKKALCAGNGLCIGAMQSGSSFVAAFILVLTG